MNTVKMNYCMQCGAELIHKYLPSEDKEIPFCTQCNAFRFPVFNTGVSMIITNRQKDKILLIKQYGGDEYILCAGYVNKGEDAENAAIREVKEELDLTCIDVSFNHSHYYAPSNTLMLNFTVIVDNEEAKPNEEIDSWQWFSIQDAIKNIRKNSLAQAFLNGYLTGTYVFPDSPALPYK